MAVLGLKAAKAGGLAKLEVLERLQPLGLGPSQWAEAGHPNPRQRAATVTAEELLATFSDHASEDHNHAADTSDTTSTSTSTSTTDSPTYSQEPAGTVAASGDQRIDGLLKGVCWDDGAITYCDPDSVTDYEPGHPEPLTDFQQISATQLQLAHWALNAEQLTQAPGAAGFSVEGFTDLTVDYLIGGSGAGTIALANTSDPSTAYAYYPHDESYGGDAFFGGTSNRAPVAGNYGWRSMLHELAHSLGLKHGHDTGGFGALPAEYDSMEYSVTTYRSYIGDSQSGYSNEKWGFSQTFMMLDIAALQYIYGADFTTNSGATTYVWTPSNGQTVIDGNVAINPGDGTAASNRIFLTIWDGGGTDTYDLSAYTTDLRIDLTPGGHSVFSAAQLADLDGYSDDPARIARGNVFNALLYQGNLASLIENATGGAGDDTIVGNQANNALLGGLGDDLLTGGLGADYLCGDAGADTVCYVSAVTVSLDGLLTATGEALGDTFLGVENVKGSAGSDWLRGDAGANALKGEGGNDVLEGMAGNDTLHAGEGDDTLDGGTGADRLEGGAGNDTYIADETADVVAEESGAGTDQVNASASYNLAANIENLVLIGTGTLTGTGNALANRIVANSSGNILRGGGGNDTLLGGGGDDTLDGEDGADRLEGGAGNDAMNGGVGTDEAVFSGSWTSYAISQQADGSISVVDQRERLSDGADHLVFIESLHFADKVLNAPVVANAISLQSVSEDTVWSFAVPTNSFADVDGDTLTYSATQANGTALPAWLSFDVATRTFAGTPPKDWNGTLGLRVTASDGTLSTSSQFNLVVAAVNDSPVAAVIAQQNTLEDTGVSFQVPAFTDVDNASLSYTATLASGTALPAWLSFDVATRTFSGTPPQDFSGTLGLRVTASDGTLSASQSFNLVVTPVNDAPLLGAIADQIRAEDAGTWNFQVPAATDVDSATLAYTASLLDGQALPTWLSFDAATRTFSGTPPQGWYGTLALKATASDGTLSTSSSFDFAVTLVNDGPTDLTLGTSVVREAAANGTVVGSLTAQDVDSTSFTYTMVDSAGGRFALSGNKIVVADGLLLDLEQQAAHVVEVQVSDNEGGSLTKSFTITLADLAPEVIAGDARANTFLGGSSNDTFDGGAGTDRLEGGAGNDTYILATSGDTVVEALSAGTDVVKAGYSYTLGTNFENLLLTGTSALSGTGNGLANLITGNGAANSLKGMAGNDRLLGLGGNDWLDGGTGTDRLEGGAGNDTYILATSGDTVVEGAGAGRDLVRAGYSTALGANLENLALTGSSALNGTGNGLSNTLTGNGAANILKGMGGKDVLNGGAGADKLTGGAGRDTLIGGRGSDDFVFRATSDSGASSTARDVITHFARGYDDIVVSSIDAKAGVSGNQAFALDTNGSFSKGEIRQKVTDAGLLVEFNTDSDSTVEMAILIQGLASKLAATDFVL